MTRSIVNAEASGHRSRANTWAARVSLAAVLMTSLLVAGPAAPSGADGNEAPASPAAARGITAGNGHTCAILADATVKCWGFNGSGQLGLGDTATRGDGAGELGGALPVVSLGTGRTATALTAGGAGATAAHTCARLDNGAVKCWGANGSGQLGIGDTATRGDGANEMGDNLPTVDLGAGRTATAITAGGTHTCALLDNATVKCWGANGSGQLGIGDTATRGDGANEMGDNLPTVDLGTGRTATAITAGGTHTCARLDNNTVKCWGLNTSGQLGQGDVLARGDGANEMGDTLPTVDLGAGRTATAITAGGTHTCALLDNATVKCWGANGSGQLGIGDTATRGDGANEMGDTLPSVSLGTGRTATAISAGSGVPDHTCARLDTGAVKCWGSSAHGQGGLGVTTSRGDNANEMGNQLPAVTLGVGHTATAITTGASYACARLDNGSIKCWGLNNLGQLGQGDSANRGDGANEMGDNLLAIRLTPSGFVSGIVTDAISTAPVPGAMVAVMRTGDFTIAGGGVAGAGGAYTTSVVPVGSYFLYVIDPTGAHTAGFFGPPTTVTVTDSATTTADPTMAPLRGAISGTITDDVTGEPVPGAEVIAITNAGAITASTVTAANGSYSVTGLSPGGYRLTFIDPTGGRTQEYFDNSVDFAGATPINVTAGSNTTANAALHHPAPFRSLSTGVNHTCAVLGDGSVRCWGRNNSGQLGLGDTGDRGDTTGEMGTALPPVNLGAGRTATTVAAGNAFTCALLDNATVKCWGANNVGQLGQGDTTVRGDGANEMGNNLPAVNLGTGRTATAIAVASSHACARLDNGTVKCWGVNTSGQLGQGDVLARGDGANEMGNNLPAVSLGTARTATAVTAGGTHTCARLDNSTVKCWGNNGNGRLGLGDVANRGDGANEMGDNLPTVSLGTGRTATAVTAGGTHTCARLDNNTVKCWGLNTSGQLGQGDVLARGDGANEMGDNLPTVDLGAGRTARSVSAGNQHTCARLDSGALKCWGDNLNGGLGQGNTTNRGDGAGEMGDALAATGLGTGRTAVAVSAGNLDTCAVLDDGTVKCWGINANGQLGLGDVLARGDGANEMGDNLPAVRFTAVGTVSGTVTDAVSSDPVPGAFVLLLRTSDFSIAGGAVAGASGDYSTSIPAGTYFEYLIDRANAHAVGFFGAPTTVTVTDGAVTDADPAMTPTRGTLSGIISVGANAGIPGAWVLAIGPVGIAGGAVSLANGVYRIGGLAPGTYRAVFVDPMGGAPVEYFQDSPDFEGATPFSIVAGETNFTVNARLQRP